MTRGRFFAQEQRGVAVAMAGALATAVVVLGLAAATGDDGAPVAFVDRLRYAIRADVAVVAWLVAAVANVARLRFFSARDIAGSSAGTGSEQVGRAGAILQNTLEQVVIAIAAHLALAATLARPQAVIACSAGLFAIGRLLFWLGYSRGATGRAFGFALTFYPSVLALLGSAALVISGRAA